MTTIPIIPKGYCHCGCGGKTNLAIRTNPDKGWIKGEPYKFIVFHRTKSPVDYLVDEKTGCWVWQRATGFKGYGCMRVNGRLVGAHRVFFEKYSGIDPGAHDVCHTCDNPPCVNPDHLFLGNASINARDMVNKGRYVGPFYKGMPGTKCILTIDQVREIKRLLKTGMTGAELGRRYKVTKHAIYQIARGNNWPHVS